MASTMTPDRTTMKFSINVGTDVGSIVRNAAFHMRLSESSIFEVALKQIFHGKTEAQLEKFLRDNGASLRRNAQG